MKNIIIKSCNLFNEKIIIKSLCIYLIHLGLFILIEVIL